MSQRAALAAGQSIGKYQVVKHLATGGMAEIYLARVATLPGLQKLVVLKRMLPELAANDEYVQMFLDEARIATLLDHPNVVHTFDAGVVDGKPFLAMEYVHGESVSSLMAALSKQAERLSVEHALAIVIGVCAGLHYVHEKLDLDGRALDIVHRDVTPQNVIVTYDGGVKLVDFGIAKSAHRAGRTRYGTIKGKAPYMSPEQCLGEALDRRSDVFSVGIMLYELTLGRRLFVGKGDYEVLKQIVEGRVVPPQTLDPGYDPALEALVLRALSKSPSRRQASARELQGELEAVARAAQLSVSSLALNQLMERCFGNKIQVLRQAQAQGNVELLSLVVEQALSSEIEELLPSSTAPVLVLPARTVDLPAAAEREVATEAALTRVARPTRAPEPSAAGARSRLPLLLLLLAGSAAAVALVAQIDREPPVTQAPAPAPPRPEHLPSRSPAAQTNHPARSAAPKEAPRTSPRPDEQGSGRLVLASSPWCRVVVDGIDRGATPLTLELPAGSHVVELSNPKYRITRRIAIAIRAHETVRKNLDFGD